MNTILKELDVLAKGKIKAITQAKKKGLSRILCFYHPCRPARPNAIELSPGNKWIAATEFDPSFGLYPSIFASRLA